MRKYILIALLLIFFVAFAWSIWLVNKPEDRVEAYSLVFAEAKSCAENYLTKTTTEFSKKRYGIEYEFIKLYESLLIPNPSNISHILKISRYNYPATSSSSSAKERLRITLDSIAYKCYPYREITTSLDGYLFTGTRPSGRRRMDTNKLIYMNWNKGELKIFAYP